LGEALYRRIAVDIRGRIESGEYAPGSQLPTEQVLRDQYQASRKTVREALTLTFHRG